MPVIVIIENKNVVNIAKVFYAAATKLYIIAEIKRKPIVKSIAKK